MSEGETLLIPIQKRTVTYSMGDLGNEDYVPFRYPLTVDLYPESMIYTMSFDYKIGGGYRGGLFELYATSGTTTTNISKRRWNDRRTNITDKLAEVELDGNEGSINVRLNDFVDFMEMKRFPLMDLGYELDLGFSIDASNYIYPIVSVYDGAGSLHYADNLDYSTNTPTTEEGLDTLTAHLKNFTITAEYR